MNAQLAAATVVLYTVVVIKKLMFSSVAQSFWDEKISVFTPFRGTGEYVHVRIYRFYVRTNAKLVGVTVLQ